MTDKNNEQFWLADVFTQDHGEIKVAFKHHKNIKGAIHVIEHRALVIAEARIEKLKSDLEKAKAALKDAAEWHNKDDVNGEAGYIAWKVLKELESK